MPSKRPAKKTAVTRTGKPPAKPLVANVPSQASTPPAPPADTPVLHTAGYGAPVAPPVPEVPYKADETEEPRGRMYGIRELRQLYCAATGRTWPGRTYEEMEEAVAQLGTPYTDPPKFEFGQGFVYWSTPGSGIRVRIEEGGRFVFEGEPTNMFTLDEVMFTLRRMLTEADEHFERCYEANEQKRNEHLAVLKAKAEYDGSPPQPGPDDHHVISMASKIGIKGDTEFCYKKLGAAYGILEDAFGSPSAFRAAVVDAVRVGEP